MLSISDIKEKQMILLNNLEGGYHLCISQGNIIIKNKDSDETLTKITRHKGHGSDDYWVLYADQCVD